ncbi:unannotated protein [freshwater metagenome]|uniref:Unannotated protein n=1 Tax=freshwater metagenome TaxID=449393 RepID=A0A6J6CFB6_9ZZZZ|nr:hypothetical protein [Actinomycetota bacterium]
MNDSSSLADFAGNRYSQSGEDGILQEIFRRIQTDVQSKRWCVEFGAWDGEYLSNTCSLIRDHGWNAVLIEGDADRAEQLRNNFPSSSVTALCAFVGLTQPTRLEDLLASSPCPSDFDFLSIDIDGCDIHILESLQSIAPKVICIEFNGAIPNEVEYVQPADFSVKQGSSALSIIGVASKKGYDLVALTATNLLFVRQDLTELVLGTQRPSLDDLRDDSDARCFIYSGFDGSLMTSKPIKLHWHLVEVEPKHLHALPRPLRRFSNDYNPFQKVLFVAYLGVKNPQKLRNWWNGRTRLRFGSRHS